VSQKLLSALIFILLFAGNSFSAVKSAQLGTFIDYGSQNETEDTSYNFSCKITADSNLSSLTVLTPGNQSFIIPNQANTSTGNVETAHYILNNTYIWEYKASYSEPNSITSNYNDGIYTISYIDNQGQSGEFNVSFLNPENNSPIAAPAQKPEFIFPRSKPAANPAVFVWEKCADADVNSIYLKLYKDNPNDAVEIETSASSFYSDPCSLELGNWTAELYFDNWYNYQTDGGISISVGKYTITSLSFEVAEPSISLSRTFSPTPYIVDHNVTVTFEITPTAEIESFTIEDIIPAGWSIVENADGTFDENSNTVLSNNCTEEQNFSYIVSNNEKTNNPQTFIAIASANDIECINIQTISQTSWKFGTFDSYTNYKLTVNDRNGNPVTFTLTGGGYGEIAGGSDFDSIIIKEANTSSNLIIKSKSETIVNNITVEGSINSILASKTNIHGNITVEGSINKLFINNVSGPSEITIAAGQNSIQANIKMGSVKDLILTSDTTVNLLMAANWQDTDLINDKITVPTINSLQIKGDFGAELNITGSLNNAKIGGTFSSENAVIAGSVNKMTINKLHGKLVINGSVGYIKILEHLMLSIPQEGFIGSIEVKGSGLVSSAKEKFNVSNNTLYVCGSNQYNIKEVCRYDKQNERWIYISTYKVGKSITSASSTVINSDTDNSGYTEVTNNNSAASLRNLWLTNSSGTYLSKWSVETDFGSIELTPQSLLTSPQYFALKQTYKSSSPLTGVWNISIPGETSLIANISGTVNSTCRLAKHEKISVSYGSYICARIDITLAIKGTITVTDNGSTYSGAVNILQKQTIWANPDVGVLKEMANMSIKVSFKDFGKDGLSYQSTQDLLTFNK
jgi:hypothetical protein